MLNAGPGKFDRIETLMKLGDAGAADSFALQMHYANNTEAKDAALLLAAAAGEANAMDELGWSLINRRNADMALAEYWLVKAAKAGQAAAMMRLGRCYRDAVYFCDAVDVKKAEHWFSQAAVTDFRRTYPSIWVDDNLALRIGIMPTSYYAGNGQRERARRVLERMRDLQ